MHSNRPLVSECLNALGDDRYRCRNTGVEFSTDVLPIHCCSTMLSPSPEINTPEHRDRIRTQLLSELQKLADKGRIPNAIPKIAMQLDLCLAPCKEFDGQVCGKRGEGCTRRKRWKEFLALSDRPCEYFEASPPT